jgi:uncharacterized repeat protein (TIGR01451 family)
MGLTGMVMVCLLGAGRVLATTADGTMITNVATATFATPSLAGPYAVSYNASAYVMVQNPCIGIRKDPNVTTQSAGGTVTYTLWVVNCSPVTSAFNITVTDKLPDNVTFDSQRGNWNGGSGGTWVPSTSPNGSAPWANGAYPPVGQTTPFYMRFVLDQLGPTKSAMIAYSVVVL